MELSLNVLLCLNDSSKSKIFILQSNKFSFPALQIQKLCQWPEDSNCAALPTPLVSVLHVKGYVVK